MIAALGRFRGLLVALIVLGGLAGPFAPEASGRSLQQTSEAPDALSNAKARALFVRGLTQSYLEDYPEAVSLFEEALEASPRQPAILSALAEAEAERGNPTSAIYYARQAHDEAPKEPYYAHTLADLLRSADRPADAKEVYRTLLSRSPGNQKARLALARLQAELGESQQALRTYEQLIDSANRPQPEAYAEMLELYREVGDEEGLERTLKTLIELRRNTPIYQDLLGQLYTHQDRYEEAIPLFEALLRKEPENPRLLSQLKMLYTETGQAEKAQAVGTNISSDSASPSRLVGRARSLYDPPQGVPDTASIQSAVRLLRRALDEVPTMIEALDLLGTIYYEQGDYGQAAPLFQRAIDENPRAPARWRRAASAHLRADSLRQAAALAEEGRLLFPGRDDLPRIEAVARLRLGDYETAQTRFEDALARVDTTTADDAERAALHAGLGHAHQQLGHLERAFDAYETALRLDNESAVALRRYAYGLAQHTSRLDRALELAQRAVSVGGATPEALGTLGWVYFKREKYAEAKSAFEKALAAGTPSARVYERFGDLQRALGNDTQARTYWKNALDRAPHRDSLKQKLDSVPQS